MATEVFGRGDFDVDHFLKVKAGALTPAIVLAGRILFSAIFILSSFGHFTGELAEFAANEGVPAAGFLVPLSGLMALIGGLSVLVGWQARLGALLLILFLLPVTFMIHNFWTFTDPTVAQIQQIMFMKNLAMLGGALMIFYFGSGPLSLRPD
jgi:putative oxidoreductase